MNLMKEYRLSKAFGVNEAGYADVPKKISGRRITQIFDYDGFWDESYGKHWWRRQHNWKHHRKTQWKPL